MLSADGIPYDYILDVFNRCAAVDETTFYFTGEEPGAQHYLGRLTQRGDVFYWAGYCDFEDGFERKTANELFHAPYYGGKSLPEQWAAIHFNTIGMLPPEDFIRAYDDVFPIRKYFTAAENGFISQQDEKQETAKYDKLCEIYHQLCIDTGIEIAQKLSAEAVRYFRSIKRDSNMMLSPPDSGLKTLWDEICVQVQWEYSFYWDTYEDYIRQYLETLIEKRCSVTQRKMLWLCTQACDDWYGNFGIQDIDELFDGNFAAEASIEDSVSYLEENVLREAGFYTNKQIRDFME